MRLLLVDDSALARGILKQALEDAGFQVVGQASNGQKGVEMARDLQPDLVIMDINMPILDGLSATRQIMADSPLPILIFSTEVEARTGFDAISAGALDIMRKPGISDFNNPAFFQEFRKKVQTLGGAVVRHQAAPVSRSAGELPGPGDLPYRIVVMGTSTGGPLAVREIISALPADFPLPILLVQHLEADFDRGYAEWLQEATALKTSLAQAGPLPAAGTISVAPVGTHLKIEGNDLVLDKGPELFNQRPAVDVLFSSAAQSFGRRVLAVLLTGMGRDGAQGCLDIRQKGGRTLVQDAATSAIFGMPRAAIELQAASEVLALQEFASRMVLLARGGA